eukprot:TRINITY_DN5743_c0_g1_i3.p1 TRINITY_DN5743_c0_g1~~TRINITY_DN5743_c0_g1_i3.p1  ORF type:complete len:411 (+),score=54.14 TRINITY_DN5743_c0_g1_i3:121-1353(+)
MPRVDLPLLKGVFADHVLVFFGLLLRSVCVCVFIFAQAGSIKAVEVVLPCTDLDVTLTFFTDTLGFKVVAIHPADNPEVALLNGYGVQLHLAKGLEGPAGMLRLLCSDATPQSFTAPNGTKIEVVQAEMPLHIPDLAASLTLSSQSATSAWTLGRAGMRYRDLVLDRQGGRFIASHIHIPKGGPVPDYVHFHDVRFQMIYCYKGWVRVIYEDQGESFIIRPGDCILQPPKIRHQVLESSDDLEVVEIGCPADHWTYADPSMKLPTSALAPDRAFGLGQRFVRHTAEIAKQSDWRHPGFTAFETDISKATDGLAGARIVRPLSGTGCTPTGFHNGEFLFCFVLKGSVDLRLADDAKTLNAADSCVVPAGLLHSFENFKDDPEWLEVSLPGNLPFSLSCWPPPPPPLRKLQR